MDPLSIVASSLAILGATGKALKGLESAWELRHRDWEFASILDKASVPSEPSVPFTYEDIDKRPQSDS